MKLLRCLSGLFFACFAFCVMAQSYIYDAGSPSYGVNIPVENGFINVSNGNLHLEFPLAQHPQRGNLKLNERLVYDSHFWKIGHYSNYYWWPDNVTRTDKLAAAGGSSRVEKLVRCSPTAITTAKRTATTGEMSPKRTTSFTG